MMLAIVVGVAGGVGAVVRYLVDGAVHQRIPRTFPYGTLLINVSGSLVLGLVTGLLWYHGLPARARLVVGVGFCGGLTTWSTAAWESVRLAEDRRWPEATLYTFGGLAAALAAATAGIALAAL
ncbi:MAG: fluoride efflux transporter CrcB [Acidimicrobiales bacterium]